MSIVPSPFLLFSKKKAAASFDTAAQFIPMREGFLGVSRSAERCALERA
jgi:hypothetical protein